MSQEERDEFVKELLICLLLGGFGVHRFMRGYIQSATLYICTGGLLGVGVILDVIAIINEKEWFMPK